MFLTFNAFAQDSFQLSLEKAVTLSVENSKQLQMAKAKISEADAKAGETKFRRFPSVEISGAHLRLNSPNITTHFGTGSSESDGTDTGGSSPEVSQLTYGMANLTQPIFSGLKLHYVAQSADYLKKASELNAESQKEEVMYNAVAAYYNFYNLRATQQLVKESVKEAKERVRVFTNLEKNGVITRNDLLKAELQQSNMELTLLDINNNIDVANYELNILLGLPEDTQITLDTTAIAQPLPELQRLDFYIVQASDSREDLKALSSNEQAASAGVKVAKGDYYPSIALTGGYVNAYIPDFLTVTNAVNVGVGVQYNLSGIFGNHHQVQEAKARQDQAAVAVALQEDKIKTEVYKDYVNYQHNLKKIETLKIANEQAEENYRITNNSYNNSLALITDLLDAQVQALQANVNMLQARSNAQLSYYKLEKSAGILDKESFNQK